VAAAAERPDPGEQLGERERLHEVVVCAGIEPFDTILHRVARGEHEDRSCGLRGSETASHLKTVEGGDHDVEDDDVVTFGARLRESVGAVVAEIDDVAFFLEDATHRCREPSLILNKQ
jgi:hypothetical protein